MSLKSKVISSLKWKYLERFGSTAISFIVSIIIARKLGPDVFGTVALLNVFINISNVFIQQGFSLALIQRDDVDERDYSTVFYISFIFSFLLYMLLFFIAPVAANFYGIEELTELLRVLSLQLFFGPLITIQNAIVAHGFEFKKAFFCNFVALIFSGTIGIVLAYVDTGPWALIAQTTSNVALSSLLLVVVLHWRPKLVFYIQRLKILLSFGSKTLFSSLIDEIYNELSTLLIGKVFSTEMLGYYNKGKQFPSLLVISIDSSIQPVMLPAYAANKNSRETVKSMLRRTIRLCAYIVFPLLIGLAVVAESLVKIALTESWLGSVPFMQMFCVALCVHPLNIANTQAINALGRSDITLKVNICKKIVGAIILCAMIPFGIYAVSAGFIVSSMFFLILNITPNRKLLNYGIIEQIKDILPTLSISVLMGVIAYFWTFYVSSPYMLISLQIFTGAVAYLGLSYVLSVDSLPYLIDLLKEELGKRKR